MRAAQGAAARGSARILVTFGFVGRARRLLAGGAPADGSRRPRQRVPAATAACAARGGRREARREASGAPRSADPRWFLGCVVARAQGLAPPRRAARTERAAARRVRRRRATRGRVCRHGRSRAAERAHAARGGRRIARARARAPRREDVRPRSGACLASAALQPRGRGQKARQGRGGGRVAGAEGVGPPGRRCSEVP